MDADSAYIMEPERHRIVGNRNMLEQNDEVHGNAKTEGRIADAADDKIRIRPLTLEDSQLIVDWRNNPRVMSRYIYREKFTLEGQERYFHKRVETGQVAQFIAEEIASGKPIGCVVLDDIQPQYAECGNWIGEDWAIGKGYSARMIRLACAYGFRELGLEDIVARIFEDNPASLHSYERAGFEIAGVLPAVECTDGSHKDMMFLRCRRPKSL